MTVLTDLSIAAMRDGLRAKQFSARERAYVLTGTVLLSKTPAISMPSSSRPRRTRSMPPTPPMPILPPELPSR